MSVKVMYNIHYVAFRKLVTRKITYSCVVNQYQNDYNEYKVTKSPLKLQNY